MDRMMNIYYKRDLEANFLVIEDETFEEDRFDLRMLEGNDLPFFLKLSLRQMNGITSLWYKVTSMHPIEQLFERRSLTGADILLLMNSLRSALDNVRTYLLEPEEILLDPSYIFMSPDRKQVRFIYVPHFESAEGSSLKGLTEFILRKLDHKDPRAVEAGYELYERVASDQEGFSRIWEDISGRIFDVRSDLPAQEQPERVQQPAFAGSASAASRREEASLEHEPESDASPKNQSRFARIRKYLLPVTAGICLTALLFWLAVRVWRLDATQIGGLFFGTLAAVWLVCTLVLDHKKERAPIWDEEDDAQEEQFWNALTQADGIETTDAVITGASASAHPGSPASFPGSSSTSRESLSPAFRTDSSLTFRADSSPAVYPAPVYPTVSSKNSTLPENSLPGRISAEEEWIHGETRALGEVEQQNRLVLISQDARRCRDLVLESSICLIGKSRSMADICIPLDVISRVHARIDQTDEGIFLTDLNSMNGTFVNGEERLIPHQRVRIREDDRISFATVHFKVARRDY